MGIMPPTSSIVKRWLVFSFVGAIGIAVQMGALLVLTAVFGLSYLPATAIAVEIAVLHNYAWHERWTWADRPKGGLHGFMRRLAWFHITNGAVSLAGNVVLMRIFVGEMAMNYILANAIAITMCSIFNFYTGECIVFRKPLKHRQTECASIIRASGGILVFLPSFCFLLQTTTVLAAELHPQTLKGWQDYVQATEQRMDNELSSKKGFLAIDFQEASSAAKERREAFDGDMPVRQIKTKDLNGRPIKVPDGMIHHWRGVVFIPNVALDTVLARVENPKQEDTKQEDVLASKIMESVPGQFKLYLKLQRSKIVTVVYNTEHLVQYLRHGTSRASSQSVATKIAEIENPRESNEREKPEGRDHGFLWRMNSYWRYEQVGGGVLVECESITLSRSIPSVLEYIIRPIINSVARESMQRTLGSMRHRMTKSPQNGVAAA